MKVIPACRLAVSVGRRAGTPDAERARVYAPPPPGYYGDYGPPLRYVLVLGGRDSHRDFRRRRGWYDPYRDDADD